MKKVLTLVAALPALAYTAPASGDIEFARPLNTASQQQVSAHAEFSYFDLSFDFLDYADKIQSRSTPEEVSALSMSVHIPLAQRISFDYQRTNTLSRVSRSAQPYQLRTDGFEHQLQLNYWLNRTVGFSTFLHAGLAYAKQKPVEIDCYDYNDLVLGGTCEEADVRLMDGQALINEGKKIYYPALITDANTFGFSVGATVTNSWPGGVDAYQYLGYEQTEINVRYQSDVLKVTDPFALNLSYKGYRLGDVISELRAELPQDTPWLEQTWVIEAGAKRNLSARFFLTGALRHYAVKRIDYLPSDDAEDFTRNTVLNLAVWYAPTPTLKVYLRGEASTNNVLGAEPIAYNRKSNKFFAHPFGQLSMGFTFSPR